jgi:putative transposase
MLISKKIRLEVSEQDAATLEFMQGKCRGLYNWWIMRLRNGEKWPGWEKAKKTLQESREHDPELQFVYGKCLQEVYFRLDGAMKAFFRRVKNGEKPGFPRVRPRHCFFTLIYPAMYIQVAGGSIRLPTGGKSNKNKRYTDVVARLTEEAPIGYRDVAISRDGQGHYYASFVHNAQEETHEHDGVLAIDLGVKTLATGVSDKGRFYHIGGSKGHRCYNRQLDHIRSKRDRCKKGSRRYKHLSQVYQRVSQQRRNKQQNCLHKASHLIAHKLVERTVVVGDLSQRQMVMKERQERNKYLNRAVYNDWGLYTFIQMLTYKCQLYGKDLQFLDERNTSKACSGCGNLQDMPLHKRTYRCVECGLVMDRDENSAVNILMRFLARLGPHTGDPVRCAEVFTAIENRCAEVSTATDNMLNTFQHI